MSKNKQFNLDEVIENAAKVLAALSTIVECGNVILTNMKAYQKANVVIDAKEAPAEIEKKEPKKYVKVGDGEAKWVGENDEIVPAFPYTKEQVRAALSEKSNADNGKYRNQVKALVKKYANGGSLTDVKEEDYCLLIAELEDI